MTDRPLRAAVCTKGASKGRFERDNRNWGLWSYGVNEFHWEIMPVWKGQAVDTVKLHDEGFDFVFVEDGTWGEYTGGAIPVVYYIVDSTLSEDHYRQRFEQCREADLVLLDHDRAERYVETGKPVQQLPHCVNDLVFRDYGQGRTADVASHMNVGGPCGEGRKQVGKYLGPWCKQNGYSYRGGTLGLEHYVRSFNAARISVNWPRFPANRSHRVLDAMACRTCLVTGRVPDVPGEIRIDGQDLIQVDSFEEMFLQIAELLDSGRWQAVADAGYECIQQHHTWRVRAGQLREILRDELGL